MIRNTKMDESSEFANFLVKNKKTNARCHDPKEKNKKTNPTNEGDDKYIIAFGHF